MSSKILFFSIGNRDLQGIYPFRGEVLVRSPATISKLIAPLTDLPILHRDRFQEKERRELKKDEPETALCFPMFDKVVEYLQDSKTSVVDHLFILCTDRSAILPKLKELRTVWENNLDQHGELYDYLDRGLIKWINDDHSVQTADFLKESLEDGKLCYDGVSFAEITVIKLGTYGELNPVMNLDTSRQVKQETLELADINTLPFFEREIYRSLRAHFDTMENSTILLGTHAGGMPMVHRALDNVLTNSVGFARYKRIYTSEYLGYKVERGSAPSFLTYLGQMSQSVINMQWDQALYCLERIKKDSSGIETLPQCATLEKVIQEGYDLWESKGSWFERYTAHILRALYTDSFNELVVWITSMEQAAKLDLARKQIGKLWKAVDADRESVELNEMTKGKLHLKLDLKTILGYFDKGIIREAFKGYADLFFNDQGWETDIWRDIRNLRNDLVHKGLAPGRSSRNKDLIYEFLGVNKQSLQKVQSAIRFRDLSAVIDFENDLLSNQYFSSLGSIVKRKSVILQERIISQRFFSVLHNQEVRDQ